MGDELPVALGGDQLHLIKRAVVAPLVTLLPVVNGCGFLSQYFSNAGDTAAGLRDEPSAAGHEARRALRSKKILGNWSGKSATPADNRTCPRAARQRVATGSAGLKPRLPPTYSGEIRHAVCSAGKGDGSARNYPQ